MNWYSLRVISGKEKNTEDNIRVECIVFGEKSKKKYGFKNYVSVIAMTEDVTVWIREGYK